jgi:hypothetical protein
VCLWRRLFVNTCYDIAVAAVFLATKTNKKRRCRPENETSPNNAQQQTTSSLNKSTTIFFIFRIFFLISWFLGSNMLR